MDCDVVQESTLWAARRLQLHVERARRRDSLPRQISFRRLKLHWGGTFAGFLLPWFDCTQARRVGQASGQLVAR